MRERTGRIEACAGLLLLLLCSLAEPSASARPGLLQTIDGRTLNGDVQFTNGPFTEDATTSVVRRLAEVLRGHPRNERW